MESPPSFSTLSEGALLSEDSGLLITSGSFSSDSASGWHHVASELQESDFDERSLSFCESADTSERMCGDFFNTVKKGPGKVVLAAIQPPPQFQDEPLPVLIDKCPSALVPSPKVVYSNESSNETSSSRSEAGESPMETRRRRLKAECASSRRSCLGRRYASPRLLHFSPARGGRPSSRASLASRLSASHGSLAAHRLPDDSSFIARAISHDALAVPAPTAAPLPDLYNVPLDGDVYALPLDTIRPQPTRSEARRRARARRKRADSSTRSQSVVRPVAERAPVTVTREAEPEHRTSPARAAAALNTDPDSLRSTLREMRRYFRALYSSTSDRSRRGDTDEGPGGACKESRTKCNDARSNAEDRERERGGRRARASPARNGGSSLKRGLCDLFRWRRRSARSGAGSTGAAGAGGECGVRGVSPGRAGGARASAVRRALPPLPHETHEKDERYTIDFATSLRRVKDYGWYWGPISVEVAEKILCDEPDGSFIVRDSSDDHYIFTLTFKLNGLRHVRIEHEQGNFCFGGCTMFKARTIVEFVEKAVETSRSGRYLFFLNLRPALGPVRVQLLYPVSRFKRVQSLQHMCRFVILKCVRRDLVERLPLPRRLLDYLAAAHYYAEMLADI